jgi:hypothetical protein
MKLSEQARKVAHAFGYPQKPKKITQIPFDYDPGHYERLCEYQDQRPTNVDLSDYALDLTYEDIQMDLFFYLLPACLNAWQEDLMANLKSEYGGFAEYFWAALATQNGFRDILSDEQYNLIANCIKDMIFEKIDQENQLSFAGSGVSPYTWVNSIGSFGIIYPLISKLWHELWNCETPGRAYAVLQYASALIYEKKDNPVFEPYTPEAGGGSPCLWECAGYIYDKPWRAENITFLQKEFTFNYIYQGLKKANQVLAGKRQSDVSAKILADFVKEKDRVRVRLEELVNHLSET